MDCQSVDEMKKFGRWEDEGDGKAKEESFEGTYRANLGPRPLRALMGYNAADQQAFVCPRSRVWVELTKNIDKFNVCGLDLNEEMLTLVDFLLPNIYNIATTCWNAWRGRKGGMVFGYDDDTGDDDDEGEEGEEDEATVVSHTNMANTQTLVYLIVLWIQVCLNLS